MTAAMGEVASLHEEVERVYSEAERWPFVPPFDNMFLTGPEH
jgi:hypothetical protein